VKFLFFLSQALLLLVGHNMKLKWVKKKILISLKKINQWGIWLAQSVEHMTLDLGVMSSRPIRGAEIT